MRMYMIPNNFVKIGEYLELNKAPDYEPFIGRSKSKILPIVYLLVCEGEVMYVGETRRGYSRPLSYHKNTVMKTQKKPLSTSLPWAMLSRSSVFMFLIKL